MSNDIDNNETLSITENVCAENDNFPSDMTEYYYRCRISNIELGAQKFYIIINTILENSNLLITNKIQKDSSDTTSFVLQQLIKYNDDFHMISMRLIHKENINSFDTYRNQFKLLMCIVNETVVLLSGYIASINSKKIYFHQTKTIEYKKYDFKEIIKKKNITNISKEAISFFNLVNRLAEIPQVINLDDVDTLIFNKLIIPFSLLFLVIFMLIIIFLTLFSALLINNLAFEVLKNINNTPLLIIVSTVLSILFGTISYCLSKKAFEFTLFSPNYDYIERKKKAYNQSKKFVIQTEIRTKIKKENAKWIFNKLFETIQAFGSK